MCGCEVAKRNEQSIARHEHEFRHSSVETEATAKHTDLRRVLAVVLASEAARSTTSASPRAIDDHRIAFAHRRHARAKRMDPAGVLVPERVRQLPRQLTFGPVHQMKIRVTRTRAADLDQNLTRSGLRNRGLSQLGWFPRLNES